MVEAEVEEDTVEVWQANWPSVLLFLRLETQWRCVARGMGGILHWLGLDYAAAAALLDQRTRREKRRHPARMLLDDLRIMEREALTVMNAGDA